MFRITDNAIVPRKAHLERAAFRLPQAHRTAHDEATRALHGHLQSVSDEAGLDTSAIVMYRRKGKLNVGIDSGPAGQALADHEYGTPYSPPNATLRQALMNAHPSVSGVYRAALKRESGF